MKVLLVRPPRVKQSVTLGELIFSEPIGLEIIYTILKDKHEVKILDLMIEPVSELDREISDFNPEVVGITSLCIDVNSVKRIAERVKALNKNIKTMVGGTQAYLNPECFIHDDIDYIAKYSTRENITKLFEKLESKSEDILMDGILSRSLNYESTKVFGRNEYIVPDRKCTQKYRSHYSYFGYKPCAIMQTSLGCSKHCDFCLRWRIEGATEKDIELECVIEQIMGIEEPNIMIFDNDFLNNRDRIERFCDLLEKYSIKKNFICYASVESIISHPETIKRARKNGLKVVLVGYETFRDEELEDYQKRTTTSDSIECSKILKELDIDCWASFMLHPDWSKQDFNDFKKYIRLLSPEIATFSPLTPFPNLPLYNKYKDRLILDVDDFESWSFGKVSIMPSKMSLRQYYFETLKLLYHLNFNVNSIKCMVRRFGYSTLFRIGIGAFKTMPRYLKLMLSAK